MYSEGIFGAPSPKSGPKVVWRWVLLCMVLGTTGALVICGFLAGLGNYVMRQQNPSLMMEAEFVPEAQVIDSQKIRLCQGKRIYIYDLPRQFNLDILDGYCENEPVICPRFMNSGLGFELHHVMDPIETWYRTDQFSMDILFHERIRKYPCLTEDPDSADLYYAPYYVGWDVLEYLWRPEIQLRDKMMQRFIGWMMAQPSFNRLQGHKHLLVLGRIVWDFDRKEETSRWGNSLLSAPELENVTAVMLERNPSINPEKEMAVPYPTAFHPRSDWELMLWKKKVATSPRNGSLVSLAATPRRDKTKGSVMYYFLRDTLFDQCNKSEVCTVLMCDQINCESNPHLVTSLLLQSTFCLQPPGDSPTRKGVFDCLVAGTIPVFFTPLSAHQQYLWHLPPNGNSYSVLFDEVEVRDNGFDVIAALKEIPASRIERMQRTIVEDILPAVVYDHPDRDPEKKSRDAIDRILDHLFSRDHQTREDKDSANKSNRYMEIPETAVYPMITVGNNSGLGRHHVIVQAAHQAVIIVL
ncbi:hypothetical protein R1sor_001157 [Riccia sorocarpa]|uniref:Exostosin GT47 domain-containing protein n=1 Tax=Riccia sorocarpa TaxID=122646 RepID=A0ABD3GYA6_9MARC